MKTKTKFKKSEIGMIPEDWEVIIVEELVEERIINKPLDGNHGGIHPKNEDFVEEGIPFIMASDLKNNYVDLIDCKFISKEQADKLQKGFAKEGDVLLSHKATIGRVAIVQKNKYKYIMLTPQVTYYRIINKKILNNYFLKYYFLFNQFKEIFMRWAGSGSTRAYLGITAQRKLPILIPPIQEQSAIAKILFDLDAKIELNQQMNKTLEAIGQAIFKRWFVDFEFPNENGKPYKSSGGEMVYNEKLGKEIPKGWEVGRLGSLMNIQNGYAFKSKDFTNEGKHRIIKIKNISGNIIDIENTQFTSDKIISSVDSRFKVHSGDLLIAMTGAEVAKVGIVENTLESLWLNQRVGLFKEILIGGKIYTYIFLLDESKQNILKSNANGAAQPNISGSQIESLKIITPNNKHLEQFNGIYSNSFNKLISNLAEIKLLQKTRDLLLPKLMSGKIRVPVEVKA